MSRQVTAYPLCWPIGRARTPEDKRKEARFGALKETTTTRFDGSTVTHKHKGKWTFARTRDDLVDELGRMKATHVVISTDVKLRLDGLPHANIRADDPGIAIYFRRKQGGPTRPYSMACDLYDRLADNCRALILTLESLRRIERHGSSQLMEQAFSGFAELPPARTGVRPWADVLGISVEYEGKRADIVLHWVRQRFRDLTTKHSFDKTGDHGRISEINDARDRARAELEPLGTEVWTR